MQIHQGERMMTYEEKIKWFKRYQEALEYENELLEELRQQMSRAENITSVLKSTPKCTTTRDKICDSVMSIIEIKEKLEQQIKICSIARNEVTSEIEKITENRVQHIMRYRYILGMRWEEMANEMGLSSKWCRTLHDRYLNTPESTPESSNR